jgi:hypothetical protein
MSDCTVLESAVSPKADTAGRREQGALDPMPMPSDRRGHRRHEISAQVDVTEDESGTLIQPRLGALNHGGCYLQTESPLQVGAMAVITIIRGSHSFQSRARVVYHNPQEGMGVTFLDTDPKQLSVLGGWLNESLERLWFAAERRKNQRILVQVPVRVTGRNGLGAFIEETQTCKIGADGCSVILSRQVSKAQHLMLLNLRTQAVSECAVAHVMNTPDGRYEVGMVFLLPNRKFWPVVFPSSDRPNRADVA